MARGTSRTPQTIDPILSIAHLRFCRSVVAEPTTAGFVKSGTNQAPRPSSRLRCMAHGEDLPRGLALGVAHCWFAACCHEAEFHQPAEGLGLGAAALGKAIVADLGPQPIRESHALP